MHVIEYTKQSLLTEKEGQKKNEQQITKIENAKLPQFLFFFQQQQQKPIMDKISNAK